MAIVKVLITLDVNDVREDKELIVSDIWGICKDDLYAVTSVKYNYHPKSGVNSKSCPDATEIYNKIISQK